jgi:cellulose synthase/poly-beta-1,6-N-acetylglucosamine synthase-like glycosyltransferase
MHILETIWWISLVILLGYTVLVFCVRPKRASSYATKKQQGVSIVIAVKNGSALLIENLHKLLLQDYPEYEVIVVDDHSESPEKEKLGKAIFSLPAVQLHHSDRRPGKKQALAMGIEKAKYDLILCTDADCHPAGPDWIKTMVACLEDNDVVLGYSPYQASTGWLNRVIRYETVMTGIQYMSWAMMGRPYMGVGRNMLYSRTLFQKVDPYKDPEHLPYGDDDLWIQQASASGRIAVCIDKASFMYSLPATSWKEWLRQKHRHLSAGHHYHIHTWWQPGLFGLALIFHWLILMICILTGGINSWMLLLFLAGVLFRAYRYGAWTRHLGDRDTVVWYPVLEAFYVAYLAVMGMFTLLTKKKSWT